MKTTGIIRRFDDLGRIIIPGAVRKPLGIKDNDPYEIFTEGNNVILKPYRPTPRIREALEAFKSEVEMADADDLPCKCRSEFLQSIHEMECRLQLELEGRDVE